MDSNQVKIYKQLGSSPAPATDTLIGTGVVNAKSSFLSWWRFNEGAWSGATGEVIDAGGISHGKSYGAVISNSGRFGNCGLFDGVDDYVEIPIVSALRLSSAISIEMWFYPTPPHSNVYGGIIGAISGYAYNTVYINDDGNITIFLSLTTGSITISPTTVATNNAWNHLVWTFDGSTHNVYLNGTQIHSVSSSYAIKTSLLKNIFIGRRYLTTTVSYYFNGKIDGVRIFNYALTADQVSSLYAENAWLKSADFSSLGTGRHKVYAVGVDLAGNQSAAGTVYNIGRLPVSLYVADTTDWYIGELYNTYLGEIDVSV